MKKAIITAVLFFVCVCAFATQFGSKMATRTASAEILFFGGFDLDKDNLPNGFKAIKSGKAGRGVEFIASSDKWKTAKIVGTVSSNKQIRMMLRSKTRKNEIKEMYYTFKDFGTTSVPEVEEFLKGVLN